MGFCALPRIYLGIPVKLGPLSGSPHHEHPAACSRYSTERSRAAPVFHIGLLLLFHTLHNPVVKHADPSMWPEPVQARQLQHATDMLDGVLYVDRTKPISISEEWRNAVSADTLPCRLDCVTATLQDPVLCEACCIPLKVVRVVCQGMETKSFRRDKVEVPANSWCLGVAGFTLRRHSELWSLTTSWNHSVSAAS